MASAQEEFGKFDPSAYAFKVYDKDSTANAVMLFEKGNYYFAVVNDRIRLIKEYHARIKILNDQGFDEADIAIPYYHGDTFSESVVEINAITHNNLSKNHLPQNKIYDVDLNERWSEKRFTFSNVKQYSILEYSYKLISPFFFNLNGWAFQSHLPKIYSEFNAKIPGNYIYNRSLIGDLKLSTNEASVEKSCFYIEGYSKRADCEVLKYAMQDVPAFRKDEKFMLAASNYISKIEFELSEYVRLDGIHKRFAKTWGDVDREFRGDADIGRQLRKKDFFGKQVPDSLLDEPDELARAKKIYAFIQKHYGWNGEYGIYKDVRVKSAFEKRSGNVGEINISLINLLNTANLKTNLILMSTRENGLPKKRHPVISDFNYVIALVTIGDKQYLLDASEDSTPFGMLPYRCLNYYGRVMDFKGESYWVDIVPEQNNKTTIRGQFNLDVENEKITGKFDQINFGHNAMYRRKKMEVEKTESDYLSYLENETCLDCRFTSYLLNEDYSNEKQLFERFEVEFESAAMGNTIVLDPIILKFFKQNPFPYEERYHPIDFGHPRNYEASFNIAIPEGYQVKSIPEQRAIALPNNTGSLRFDCRESNGVISIIFVLNLKQGHFTSDYYGFIKEFFNQVTQIQNNSIVLLEKT